MNLFSQGYNALLGDKGQTQTISDTVDKLVDRLKFAGGLEDRRTAALGLRTLCKDYQLEVGTKALSLFIQSLRSPDMKDFDMALHVLNALYYLCVPSQDPKKDPNLGIQFTEILISEKDSVSSILTFLKETDYELRSHSIRLLQVLMENVGGRLQEQIMVVPNGVPLIVDLLDDHREVIRNDALLLLISLTQANADIQKIIAFENAFERITDIILEEGGIEGDIVVQDCLQLMLNLLKYNISNQNYFRESNCLARLVHLFDTKPLENSDVSVGGCWTDQKMENTCIALDLIRILVSPDSPTTESNQGYYAVADIIRGHEKNQKYLESAQLVAGPGSTASAPIVLVAILETALTRCDYYPLRTACAYLFECYLYGNSDGQIAVASTFKAPPNYVSPGSLIANAVADWSPSKKDPLRSRFACFFLSLVLAGNPHSKRLALAHKIDLDVYGEIVTNDLLYVSFAQLMAASRDLYSMGASTVLTSSNSNNNSSSSIPPLVAVLVGYLELLLIWVEEHPEAVRAAFQQSSHLNFIIEHVLKSSPAIVQVQGLAALLLGYLYEYNDDSNSNFTKSTLHPIIVNSIGLDVFFNRMKRLKDSSEFNNSSRYLISDEEWIRWERWFVESSKKQRIPIPEIGGKTFFSPLFAEKFKNGYEMLQKVIVRKGPLASSNSFGGTPLTPSSSNGITASAKPQPMSKLPTGSLASSNSNNGNDVSIASVASGNASLALSPNTSQHMKDSLSRAETEATNWRQKYSDVEAKLNAEREALASLRQDHTQLTSKYKELEKEQEDLLVCLAEQDLEMKKLKDRLRLLGQHVDDDDDDDDIRDQE